MHLSDICCLDALVVIFNFTIFLLQITPKITKSWTLINYMIAVLNWVRFELIVPLVCLTWLICKAFKY